VWLQWKDCGLVIVAWLNWEMMFLLRKLPHSWQEYDLI
jgi:hypothetical protein